MAQNITINASKTVKGYKYCWNTLKKGQLYGANSETWQSHISCKVNFMAQNVYYKTRDSIKPYEKQDFFSASVTWQGQRSNLLR